MAKTSLTRVTLEHSALIVCSLHTIVTQIAGTKKRPPVLDGLFAIWVFALTIHLTFAS